MRLFVTAAVTATLLAGCSTAAAPEAAKPTLDPAVQAECDAVERAYTAWKDDPARVDTAAAVQKLDKRGAEPPVEAGKRLGEAVATYTNPELKAFTGAVVTYNFELVVAVTPVTAGAKPAADPTAAAKAGDAAAKVHQEYTAYRTTRCTPPAPSPSS